MLGIVDSGLGGLTVLRHVRERLPQEDLVYLADQAYAPYGDREPAELARLLAENVAFLEAQRVDAIVMGCNTSCAVAAERGWPAASVAILDLIGAAATAVAASGARRVGVLATSATVRSGAYGRAIRAAAPGVVVQECAAPKLVPLVESGLLAGPQVRAAVAEACCEFRQPLDALVLACTHYPLLDREFAAVLGDEVRRIDPAFAQAERTVAFVRARGGERGSGHTTYVTTGPVDPYRTAVTAIVGTIVAGDVFAHLPLALAPI